LKMLEGTVANIPPQGGRKHPEQQYIQMDTTHILFICGGTFTGLDDIIRKRLGRQMIGFGSEDKSRENGEDIGNVLQQVEPHDLVEFGMIPELIGRLPVVTALDALDEEAMIRILTEPRNAICRQYKRFFELEETHLEFAEDGLVEIARKALSRDVGARALRAVVESVMLELMYDLPDHKEDGATYEITGELVRGDVETTLFSARKGDEEKKKESA
ncbi:MAG: AAA family ATPase, partial [Phycisphaerae bacterium]